jgi:competence protein ComEA
MRALFTVLALVAIAALPAAAQQKPASRSSKPAASRSAAAAPSSPVNLNSATQAQIETLPGIGPKVAQRIIEYRQKNGPFKKIEDLMNVKGVGEKSFLKLKPYLTVTEKTDRPGASPR